jgi:23S rRNA (pseudouridine1915-N3)-methyltransferase
MKICFCSIGKGHEEYVKKGIDDFTERIGHYYPVSWKILPSSKHTSNTPIATIKEQEAKLALTHLSKQDYLVLLDEHGQQLSSENVANFIQRSTNNRVKNLVFFIGGAYGVADELWQRANFQWSLSTLVFPHQLTRLILAEQVYRACTILKNEKYHHA